MAETLRQRIEALRDEHATEAANRRYVLVADIHADEAATLTAALALPDDPRDAKLRAFAGSMTPEMWEALCGDLNEGMATSTFEDARTAVNALREALTR